MRRRTRLVAPLLAVALAACGGGTTSPAVPTPTAPSQTAGAFTLTSPVAVDGGTLPAGYTCDGVGATIALFWSNAPAGHMTIFNNGYDRGWSSIEKIVLPGDAGGRDLIPKGVIELPASQKGKTGLDKADAPPDGGRGGKGRGGVAS